MLSICTYPRLCVETHAYLFKLHDIMSFKKVCLHSNRKSTEQTSSVYYFKIIYFFLLKQNSNKNQSFYKHSKNYNLIQTYTTVLYLQTSRSTFSRLILNNSIILVVCKTNWKHRLEMSLLKFRFLKKLVTKELQM